MTGPDAAALGRPDEGPPVTPELGRWIARLRPADVPDRVLRHAKLCLLDAIGCGLFGARQPWGLIAAEVAAELSEGGPAILFGRRERTGPADAALANGTAIHGFELDDIHVASSYHPGSVTVPVCLGLAGTVPITGADFLTAMVAGYEIGIRLGICAGITHSTSGYHVTGTVGSVGAAAGAARSLGLDAEAATHAIGIGATQAAGLYAARTGAMAKRFHAGRAAQSGVVAAFLARRGFTGSAAAIEAPFGGFLSVLNGQFAAENMLEDLGTRWETGRVGFKAYASCASSHTTVDALHTLMAKGLNESNLERLIIRMSRKGAANIGWTYRPAEVVSAQMNGYYVAAVTIIDKETFIDQFREERLADPAIMRLIERIEIRHDPDLDRGGAAKRHAVHVEAVLKDQTLLRAYVEQRRGSVERPLSNQEVVAKFSQILARTPSHARTGDILDLVMRLDDVSDVKPLLNLLVEPRE